MKVRVLISAYLMAIMSAAVAYGQDVRNTSFTGPAGDRVLRFETTVGSGVQQVWAAFTTTAGLSSWFSPLAVMDFRVGGAITPRDPGAGRIGDTGVARLDILSYREMTTLTFHVRLDETFSETIREQDDELRQIVELMPLDNNRTALTLSISGWGKGRIWDDAYAFFSKRAETMCVRVVSALSTQDRSR